MENFGNNLRILRENKGITQTGMLAAIGIERTTWSNYENGKSFPNLELFTKIAKFFGVSADDLLFSDFSNAGNEEKPGEQDRGKFAGNNAGNIAGNSGKKHEKKDVLSVVKENGHEKEVFRMPQVVTIDTSGQENVIMVPVRARAGYLNGYGDPDFISHLPAYRLPGLNHGTFRLFEVEGHSMHPTFEDKDILVTKFVESLDFIRDDRIYVVVTKNHGVVVKAVINRIKTEGKIILKSDNKKHHGEYPDIVINPNEVLEIWYGVLFLSRYMRRPSEMYNRLIDVEARLTLMEHDLKKK